MSKPKRWASVLILAASSAEIIEKADEAGVSTRLAGLCNTGYHWHVRAKFTTLEVRSTGAVIWSLAQPLIELVISNWKLLL